MRTKILEKFSRFLTTRANVFSDPIEETRFLQYTVFVIVGMIFMSSFGVYNWFLGRMVLCAVLVLSIIGLCIGWGVLYRGVAGVGVYRVNGFVFYCLLMYLLYLGTSENSLALWVFVFPLIVFFLLGRTEGMIASVMFWFSLLFFFYGHDPPAASTGYSVGFSIRLIIVYSIVSFITFTYENFRFISRRTLEETNRALKIEIDERRRIERSLAESELRYHAIYLHAAEGILLVNEKGEIVECNPQMLEMLGFLEKELIGRNVFTLIHPEDLSKVPSQLDRLLAGETILLERRLRTSSGIYLLCEQSGKRIGSDLLILLYRDITERKLAELALERANQALDKLAHMDGLTQVANRRKFDNSLALEWKKMGRENQKMGIILADIDYFKQYNDIYGHQAGDECLKRVASVISALVHRPGDMVARYGGEEFVILLPDTNIEGCRVIAEKVRERIEELRLSHKGSECSTYVTMSLGVAVEAVIEAERPADLIGKADKALYQAKEAGRNRVC